MLENAKMKLSFVMSPSDMGRIQLYDNEEVLKVVADVHGMSRRQADRFISNIINLIRHAFRLIIVHGYNNGTVIKEYFENTFKNANVLKIYESSWNKGVTYIEC